MGALPTMGTMVSRLRWLILVVALICAIPLWILLDHVIGIYGILVFALYGIAWTVRGANRISYGDPEGPKL